MPYKSSGAIKISKFDINGQTFETSHVARTTCYPCPLLKPAVCLYLHPTTRLNGRFQIFEFLLFHQLLSVQFHSERFMTLWGTRSTQKDSWPSEELIYITSLLTLMIIITSRLCQISQTWNQSHLPKVTFKPILFNKSPPPVTLPSACSRLYSCSC